MARNESWIRLLNLAEKAFQGTSNKARKLISELNSRELNEAAKKGFETSQEGINSARNYLDRPRR